MRAILLPFLTSLVLTAPVAAEIVDLRARLDDGHGRIWIAFDEQPSGLTTEVTETGLNLTVTGVEVGGRAISPASDTLVAAVSVDPIEQGGVIHLYASRAWTGARAELRQGGILVSMEIDQAAPIDVVVAERDAVMPAGSTLGETALNETTDPMGTDSGAPTASAPSEPTTQTPTPLFEERDASARGNSAVAPPGACVAEAEAVEQSPWDDNLLHAQAACLSAEGHLASAASIYERMLAFEPENFRATVALAEIRVEQGDNQAARDLYDQAASHAISDAEAARARARLRALREQ
ncbi:tetratricopeptide repeat protein [uncultured Maricaulis sp.]|uniref:tetratricopeptide repeat protein n=1 Tax=uncultured Maricaulis sp. TaxID=174710 RepID=UPI002605ED0E|nr:tetratricopeptide repeat protein [uncultured Maricaulis sp.]